MELHCELAKKHGRYTSFAVICMDKKVDSIISFLVRCMIELDIDKERVVEKGLLQKPR